MNQHRKPKLHPRTLTPRQQAYIAAYRRGWRAYVKGVPYSRMRSDARRNGWVASWNTELQSPALAAVREAVGA